MADEMRELAREVAGLAADVSTLAGNQDKVFGALYGRDGEGGIVTRVAVVEGKRKALSDRVDALEAKPDPEAKGSKMNWTSIVLAIMAMLTAFISGCFQFLSDV